jgi:choline kinase
MVGTKPVYVDTVDGMFWAEVDYVEDYERILKHRGYEASFSLKAKPIVGENH